MENSGGGGGDRPMASVKFVNLLRMIGLSFFPLPILCQLQHTHKILQIFVNCN